jgi:energy-coupling factor transport system ATP-binding protein
MISISRLHLTYAGESEPVLRDVNLDIAEGEFVLVVGHTGAGKSSLLRVINGLAPHHTGGRVAGDVVVFGRSIRDHRPRDMADLVGVVTQDPLSGFVTDTVEEEIAFGMESLALAPDVMRKRVEETLDLLSLAPLRRRVLSTLSGGEQQRVAIASVLAMHPKVLVLDEPTSALDPTAAEEVLSILQRLVHDLGITVIVAEHRLERVVQYVDRVIHVTGDGTITDGPVASMMAESPLAPPVVVLGRAAGWTPLPLSVRDARRMAEPLREQLAALAPTEITERVNTKTALVTFEDFTVNYGSTTALRDVSLQIQPGEIAAVMGRNGAGKSTLLSAMVGLRKGKRGSVRLGGHDPHTLKGSALVHLAGYVPQEPSDLLYADTVSDECALADRDAGVLAGTARKLFEQLAPGVGDFVHPRDLSEGQRLSLVLAVVLAAKPPLVILDEPTRGLDYQAKARLISALRRLSTEGHGVVLATHDVELVAELATRVVVIAEGEIVTDGPTQEVITSSPSFAPQVAKVLAPGRWLTVDAVREALDPEPWG